MGLEKLELGGISLDVLMNIDSSKVRMIKQGEVRLRHSARPIHGARIVKTRK